MIKQKLAQIVSDEITEDGVGIVTVTEVEVSVDLRQARVYYTIYKGTLEKKVQKTIVENKAKVIRKRLAERIELKYIPFLDFIYDRTTEKASKIEEILRKIKDEKY